MIDVCEAGYSAPITLELHVDNEILKVSKVGPDRIVLSETRPVPEGAATLIIKIGNSVRQRSVILNRSNAAEGTVHYF